MSGTSGVDEALELHCMYDIRQFAVSELCVVLDVKHLVSCGEHYRPNMEVQYFVLQAVVNGLSSARIDTPLTLTTDCAAEATFSLFNCGCFSESEFNLTEITHSASDPRLGHGCTVLNSDVLLGNLERLHSMALTHSSLSEVMALDVSLNRLGSFFSVTHGLHNCERSQYDVSACEHTRSIGLQSHWVRLDKTPLIDLKTHLNASLVSRLSDSNDHLINGHSEL